MFFRSPFTNHSDDRCLGFLQSIPCLKAIESETTSDQGLYSPTIPKNILCLLLKDFVNLNVTQLLIGSTVWFSQSEVVLHSNAAKSILVEKSGEKKKKKNTHAQNVLKKSW